jgi:hypothetical protein
MILNLIVNSDLITCCLTHLRQLWIFSIIPTAPLNKQNNGRYCLKKNKEFDSGLEWFASINNSSINKSLSEENRRTC